MTLSSQQETAVYVVRVLLRRTPAEAAAFVSTLENRELAEICQLASHLSELRDQLRQICSAVEDRKIQDAAGPGF